MEKTRAMLYKKTDRWQIWVCLLAIILLFACAVALVRGEPPALPSFGTGEGGIPVEITPSVADPEPAAVEGLPPPQMQSEIADETAPPPPPALKQIKPRAMHPLAGPGRVGVIGLASLSSAKVFALSAPRPEYPYEARRQRLTGSGVAVLQVDTSGVVTNVSIARSTGSAVLDNAAMSGFRRWRFRPGTVSKVNAPITFTLTGAAY